MGNYEYYGIRSSRTRCTAITAKPVGLSKESWNDGTVNKDQTKYGKVSFTSLPFHDGHSRLFQNGDCSSLVTFFISTSNKQQDVNL